MRMNGNVKFGSLMVFFGGSVTSDGVDALDKDIWTGIAVIVVGLIIDVVGINLIDRGIQEAIRMRDLEIAAKIRKTL